MKNSLEFGKFGVMLDCSRNAVMKPQAVKKYIDILSELGYNCLMLYTEDTYEIEGQPYFGRNRGAYTQDELRDIDAYAASKGIELMPCIQTLAHLGTIFRWKCYDDIRDCEGILLCGEEKTYKLIDDMFSTLSKCFSSRTVNIGMDEAHLLGCGEYMRRNGVKDRFEILLEHLNRVAKIAEKYGFSLIMWGDMFFRLAGGGYDSADCAPENVKSLIPDNVNLIYWDYYSTDSEQYSERIKLHEEIKENIWFAGGLWSWRGFAPSNGYSVKATKAALSACKENGVKNVFLTMWGDNGGECSRFAMLPSLYYAASIAHGITEETEIEKGFQSMFGISYKAFCEVDLPHTAKVLEGAPIDPEKYFLYNDCFMGLYDNLVSDSENKRFLKQYETLKPLYDNSDYGKVFKYLGELCRALSVKAELGIKTRNAYKDGNKEDLKELLPIYDETERLIGKFYSAYESWWMWENKPHGFDVQDIRLGGLLQRVRHCKARLAAYINGETDIIDELLTPVLDSKCRTGKDLEYIGGDYWENIVTANRITAL